MEKEREIWGLAFVEIWFTQCSRGCVGGSPHRIPTRVDLSEAKIVAISSQIASQAPSVASFRDRTDLANPHEYLVVVVARRLGVVH